MSFVSVVFVMAIPTSRTWHSKTALRLFDEREVTLRDFGRDPSVRFVYTYDFGDNWRHIVEIEEWLALDDTPRFAACLDGARARPPEDVGGVSGYEAFLEIMSDPLDAEHTEMKRWCGGHFDPEWFDLGWVDRDVRNALRPTRAGGCTSPNQRSAGHGSKDIVGPSPPSLPLDASSSTTPSIGRETARK